MQTRVIPDWVSCASWSCAAAWLGELLGLSGEEIAALEAEGVTGTAPNWSVHE